jgi:hypothetical protein
MTPLYFAFKPVPACPSSFTRGRARNIYATDNAGKLKLLETAHHHSYANQSGLYIHIALWKAPARVTTFTATASTCSSTRIPRLSYRF